MLSLLLLLFSSLLSIDPPVIFIAALHGVCRARGKGCLGVGWTAHSSRQGSEIQGPNYLYYFGGSILSL